MNSPRTKHILVYTALFLIGAISGAGLAVFFHPLFCPPPRPGEMQQHVLRFLTNRLHLTPDQVEKITPITFDLAKQADALRQQSVLQFNQLADATDSRIAEFLTPDQKAELVKIGKERAEKSHLRGGPPGLSDGPPGP